MKNKGLKKFFAVFLSAAMSLSVYATPVFAEATEESATENAEEIIETEENVSDVAYSGKSGDLDWKIDTNGTLTISGTGDYELISQSDKTGNKISAPIWMKHADKIKRAVVTAKGLTSTVWMFAYCDNLTEVDLSKADTSNVTDMWCMFYYCSNLKSIDLSKLNTSNVTDMQDMFFGCSGLTSLDLRNFNTSKVKNMITMFCDCSNLREVNISTFDTSNVTNMTSMFMNCTSLSSLDLSNFDTSKAKMEAMFANCSNLNKIRMPKAVKGEVDLPSIYYITEEGAKRPEVFGIWKDENGNVCTKVTKNLSTPMTYTKVSGSNTGNSTPNQPSDNNNNSNSQGTKVASYQGNNFYQGGDGKMRCYDANGNMVKNNFKCDGTYTYYFQNDGTAMTDRLTYHPDGEHVIYFDENGHEVFSNFAHIKKSIAGDAVDDLCFFDVYGHMYVDFITYDQAGVNLYYANPYGVMEHNGWFQFSDGNIGYANADATLMTNQFSYDQFGRKVYFQGDGKLARGLISDGTTYYQMDETDGHCVGEFPVQ